MPGLKSTFFDVILFLPENLRCHKFRLYRTLESSKRCITPGESIFLNFLILSIFFIQHKLQQRFKGTIGLKMIINNNNCSSRARSCVCACACACACVRVYLFIPFHRKGVFRLQ